MSVETQIQQLHAEISSLEAEVKSLHHTHDQLYRDIHSFEAENRFKKLSKRSFSAIPPAPPHDADDTPALIHYSYFDPSISKYFPDIPANQNSTLKSQKILETISLKTTAGHVALTESIMRFGGITAFPINQHLYDSQEDSLLGLRFDLLSPGEGKFVTPHYIILRRCTTDQKDGVQTRPWSVFRYTTPTYVQLDRYSKLLQNKDESDGLQQFMEKVRSRLVHVHWKHELFDRVQATTMAEALGVSAEASGVSAEASGVSAEASGVSAEASGVSAEASGVSAEASDVSSTRLIVSISRDLECHRVTMAFKDSSFKVEMICTDSSVESSTCIGGNQAQALTIQAMLCGAGLEEFIGVFYKIVYYMQENGLFHR